MSRAPAASSPGSRAGRKRAEARAAAAPCAALERSRFSAALGIATNILADRLRRLLAAGVLEQHLYQERPPRHEYRLTAKGWDLFPFTIALHDWGSRWIPSPHGPGLKLRHLPCDHRLRGVMTCGACHAPIEPQDVTVRGASRWAARRERPAGKGKAKRRGATAAARAGKGAAATVGGNKR